MEGKLEVHQAKMAEQQQEMHKLREEAAESERKIREEMKPQPAVSDEQLAALHARLKAL